jgi:cytochrome c oxidase subunit III
MKVKAVADVKELPSEVFGSGNLTWWGALGGEVIEGLVVVLGVFALFYLKHLSPDWPPRHSPLPSLGIPTLNLVLMVLSAIPAWWAAKAARKMDRKQTLIGLVVHAVFGVVILYLRYWECRSLNVRWDTNAYGSVTWALLFSHGYIALFDVFDTIGLSLLYWRLEPAEKHHVDVDDNSFFWYFVIATWIPLYVIVFIMPRF